MARNGIRKIRATDVVIRDEFLDAASAEDIVNPNQIWKERKQVLW